MAAASSREFSAWLSERSAFLHGLEKMAERALQKDKDTHQYHALMRQKAAFLVELPAEATKRASGLPEDIASLALSSLEQFAQNASRALELDSVFYMYALLYPDNHVKGQPNNLDLLAARIAALAEE